MTVTVGKSTSTTSLTSSLAAPVVGQSTTLTAAVTTGSGSAAGGTVTFYDGSAVLGTGVVGADGQATLTTALRVGSRTLRAVYSGDNFSLGSTSTPLSLTVGRAVTSTGLTLSTSTAGVGQSVIVTANVGVVLGSAFPVGTVEFREGTKLLGTATVDGRGTAKLTLTNLPAGSHAITANYLGCSTCLGSTSLAATVSVGSTATATTLTSSTPSPVFGQTQTLTARVMGAVSGRVNFFDGTTLLGSATVDASGSASLAARLNLGSHKLKAVFAGTASARGQFIDLGVPDRDQGPHDGHAVPGRGRHHAARCGPGPLCWIADRHCHLQAGDDCDRHGTGQWRRGRHSAAAITGGGNLRHHRGLQRE